MFGLVAVVLVFSAPPDSKSRSRKIKDDISYTFWFSAVAKGPKGSKHKIKRGDEKWVVAGGKFKFITFRPNTAGYRLDFSWVPKVRVFFTSAFGWLCLD